MRNGAGYLVGWGLVAYILINTVLVLLCNIMIYRVYMV